MTTPRDAEAAAAKKWRHDQWRVLGIFLLALLVLAGLAMLAFAAFMTIAFSSYGSNK